VSENRIMYVCSNCADNNPEGCGHYHRGDLRVHSNGQWLCDDCWDEADPRSEWDEAKVPPEYKPDSTSLQP
jgi:hypothetical protein